MRRFCICIFGLTLSTTAFAGPRDFVVEHAGVGGTAEQAAPYLDQFLKYTEEKLGWKDLKAKFFPEPDAAFKEYLATEKPGFGMIDPDQWLELAKKDQLTLLATVEGKNQSLGHLSVVTKNPALSTLEAMQGKTLTSTHLQSPRFLSRVVFDGKADVEKEFKLQPKASTLKVVKAVAQGEADLALLSDEEVAWMKGSPYAADVKVVWTSGALPPMSVSAFGKISKPADRQAFSKMLLGMCSDQKGAEICKALDITKFAPPDQAAYDAAMKKYGTAASTSTAKGRKAPTQ